MIDILYNTSLPFATIALVAFTIYTFKRSNQIFAIATLASLIAFLCLTFLLPVMVFTSESGFFMQAAIRDVLYAWVIMAIYFVAEFKYRIRLLGSILMPMAVILLLLAIFEERHEKVVNTVDLSTIPTFIHVTLILVSTGLIFLASSAALLYLVKRRALKRHQEAALDADLPAITTLKQIMRNSFQVAFPIYTMGVILGAIYAGATLAPGWLFSPFILIAGFVWLLQAWLFYMQQVGKASSLVTARVLIVLLIMMISLAAFSKHREMLKKRDAATPSHAVGQPALDQSEGAA